MTSAVLRKVEQAVDNDDIGDIKMTDEEKETVKNFTKFFKSLGDTQKHELITKLMLLRRLSDGYVAT